MHNAISEIMTPNMEFIDMTESAQKAAKKMKEKRISSLLVVDNTKKNKKEEEEEPVGIVTERDLVNRVCAEGISGREVSVREIMSSPIETVEGQATIETAADLMLSNNVRHLLVIDEQTGKPMGIIAPSDLNRYLRANMDMDEVNARILKTIQAEEGWQL
jgi:CBS domain-containing protein